MKFTEKEEFNDDAVKITDLNDYCLVNIFDYLRLKDLLNVAQSNKILQYAALLSFKYKYGDKNLDASHAITYDENDYIFEKKVRNFMLIFGDLITSIKFSYTTKLIGTIFKHPLKSLVKLKFRDYNRGMWKYISKLFPNVKSVSFERCYLHNENSLISEIFPNLCYMEIWSPKPRGRNYQQIQTNFPNMKELHWFGGTEESARQIVRLNPQLTKLKLRGMHGLGWKFMQFIAEEMQLEHFKYGNHFMDYGDAAPIKPIHFKTLKHFDFSGSNDDDELSHFSFDQIEQLSYNGYSLYIHQIDKIIKQNEKLVDLTLKINSIKDLNTMYKSTMLSRLTKIKFHGFHQLTYIQCNAIINFLNKNCFASEVRLSTQKIYFGEIVFRTFQTEINKSKWNFNYYTYEPYPESLEMKEILLTPKN